MSIFVTLCHFLDENLALFNLTTDYFAQILHKEQLNAFDERSIVELWGAVSFMDNKP